MISNQISQQTLDVDFITCGSCADVSGKLTNCVLDVRTIQTEQPTKQLSVTSLSRFVRGSVIVIRFLETVCVGSLECQSQSLCTILSRCRTKLQTCKPCGTKNDPGTLEACQSPCSDALPCLSQVPATNSSSLHWDPQPACRPHTRQCKCPVPCSQTNKDRAHLERNFVLSTSSTGVLASVTKMFEDTAWPCALSTPHVCHPSEPSGSNLQVAVHAAFRLRGLER